MKLLDQLGLQYLIEKFKEWFELKQDKLTAGDNITITNNTISATDTVYDDTAVQAELGKKADKTYVDNKVKTDVPLNAKFTDTIYTHPTTHPASMITGLPTTLPASGGNADTVGGFTVGTNVPAGAKFTDTIVDISGKLSKSNDTLETYTEKIQATTGIINLSLANVFTDTPSASRTYSITNAKSGVAHSFTLIITMGATVQTLTFPASVKWQGGEIPDMTTANKTYVLTFVTVDGGTTWLGMFGGEF